MPRRNQGLSARQIRQLDPARAETRPRRPAGSGWTGAPVRTSGGRVWLLCVTCRESVREPLRGAGLFAESREVLEHHSADGNPGVGARGGGEHLEVCFSLVSGGPCLPPPPPLLLGDPRRPPPLPPSGARQRRALARPLCLLVTFLPALFVRDVCFVAEKQLMLVMSCAEDKEDHTSPTDSAPKMFTFQCG